MKQLLSFLIVTTLIAGCAKSPKGVTITGMIDNLGYGSFVMGGPGGSRDSVFLDDSKNFLYEIKDHTEAGTFYMIFPNEIVAYLYLAPGMELDFYADVNNFKESAGFSGKGSDINNYVISKNPRAFDYSWFGLPEADFFYKVDSVLAEQQGNLLSASKENPEDLFWVTEEAELLFSWANNLGYYPNAHPYYSDDSTYQTPEDWYDFRNKLDVNNPEYLKSNAFNSYVSTIIQEKASEKYKEIIDGDSTAEVNRRMLALTLAAEVVNEPKVLDHYYYSTVSGAMQWSDLSDIQEMITFFNDNCQDQEYIEKFNKALEEWRILDKGQPMFDFEGKDLEGNVVKSTDFRGKYLYVDVWATWCGPCIHEIPYLKQLEEDYHDRNIVFLSYSIDEDHAAWLKFVPEKELGGVQIIGENAWQSKLCKDYKIMGVPTFMFFDTEGKIISAKMTRPSDQKTRDRFDSYNDL